MADQNLDLPGYGHLLQLEQIASLQEKPLPFTPGQALFWDDPHISSQMLAAHLDPNIEAASRRPEVIDRSVDWIVNTLNLQAGDALLDLGCGPGLYASRLARMGLSVTGVDYSRRSIAYADNYAHENNLNITYRYENYLDLSDTQLYAAVLLIYGDFCPLNPVQRTQLLGNIYKAIKPGGRFVLDVSTRKHRNHARARNGWRVEQNGFWRPGLHLVMEQGFDYPENDIFLNQYIVVDADGSLAVYRNWFQDYTPQRITSELESGGFVVESLWSDLCGTHYDPETEWIGVVARKK